MHRTRTPQSAGSTVAAPSPSHATTGPPPTKTVHPRIPNQRRKKRESGHPEGIRMDEVGFEYLDDENDDVGIQTSMEFKPVDHPLEPPNEDCSAKWPFPTSALDGMVHAGNVTKCNVPLEGDNFKKEGDVTNEGVHLAKAVNKRRRGVRDDTEAQQVKGPVISIFQVFQQCKEL